MMFKKLLDFKSGKKLAYANLIRLTGIVVAIVIFAFGVKEILDVKHMKEVLDVSKLIMGDVLIYLSKKYLGWVALVLGAAFVGFFVLRYQHNKEQAA